MQPDEKSRLMHECLGLHLDGAARSFKKSMLVALAIAGIGAMAVGVLSSSIGVFVVCLLLFAVLSAPIPFAVRYVNVSRIHDLRRKLEASAGLIASVRLERAQTASAAGAAAIGVIYASRERVVVTTTSGEQYALWLPGERAQRLVEAFQSSGASGDFESQLAKLQSS